LAHRQAREAELVREAEQQAAQARETSLAPEDPSESDPAAPPQPQDGAARVSKRKRRRQSAKA
jgi:hypothetical protein